MKDTSLPLLEDFQEIPPELWAKHCPPSLQYMARKREESRIEAEKRESKQLGTVSHLREAETGFSQDQEKFSDTCEVSLYPDGMGLRVERRKSGYSWAGKKTGHELVGEGDQRAIVKSGGKRGRCKGATTGAMARMRDAMYKVRRDALPVMITLGWPRANTPDAEEAKRCLNHILIALGRKYQRSSGFWKLEHGASGLPHYHILLWGAQPWKGWLSSTWYRICATGNPDHFKSGTRVEKLRSYRGTLAYAGKKYCTKVGLYPSANWGRVWGCFRKALLPLAQCIKATAPWRVGMWFSRTLRRYMKAQTGGKIRTGGRGRVLWRTIDFASQWLRVLEWAESLPVPSRSYQFVECPF